MFVLIAVVNYTNAFGYDTFANLIVMPVGVLSLGYLGLLAIGSILQVEKKLKLAAGMRQTSYLSKIGYERRVREAKAKANPAPPASDDNADYKYTWLTRRYDPDRLYSYSKSERDYMKMMGMDADTYDSNMPG